MRAMGTMVMLLMTVAGPAGIATVAEAASSRHGNVELTLSGSNLLLSAMDGEGLYINGVTRSMPSGGFTLSSTGTAANTTYYIYAYWTGSAIALEYSTTVPDVDSTAGRVGIRIKYGANTRTLVGMARTNGSAQWVDSPTQRFVISWFNRRPIGLVRTFADNRTFTSQTFVEVSSSERLEFLTWGDSAVQAGYGIPMASASATPGVTAGIAFDGSTPTAPTSLVSTVGPADTRWSAGTTVNYLSEGYHYATIAARSSSTTVVITFFGGDVNAGHASLYVVIFG